MTDRGANSLGQEGEDQGGGTTGSRPAATGDSDLRPRASAAAREYPRQSEPVASRLLALLAEEASTATLASVVDVVAPTLAPEGLEAARRDISRALRIRRVLEGRRRREQELAALYLTANDLSSLRDVDEVLHAIVQRAKLLLAADAAYMTLYDDLRGDTYMRETAGIATEGFRRARIPLGGGLGGLVFETASPHWTPDYLGDPVIRHVDELDELVHREGLTAMIGVPLQRATDVIGVLFVANRGARQFTQEEVALLSSLADHAVVALHNAQLFQDLSEANAAIQEVGRQTERAAAIHERLSTLVLKGGGVEDVVQVAASALGGHLLVVDAQSRLLAAAGPPQDTLDTTILRTGEIRADWDIVGLHEAIREAEKTGHTAKAIIQAGARPRWVTPMLAGSDPLGYLIVTSATGKGDLDRFDLRLLEVVALVTALVLMQARSLAEAESRARGDLVEDLLSGRLRDPRVLRRHAQLVGVNLDRQYSCLVADPGGAVDPRRIKLETDRLALEMGGVAGIYDGSLVLFLPDIDLERELADIADRLRVRTRSALTIGAAESVAGPEPLAASYAQARACLRVLLALGRTGAAATAAKLGFFGVLFGLGNAGRGALERFVSDTLGPVLRYDAERSGDLLPTLEAFFAAGGHMGNAATALHVHVNTLYGRLERVDRLLGSEWRQPDHSLQLHLALRLHRLNSQIEPEQLGDFGRSR